MIKPYVVERLMNGGWFPEHQSLVFADAVDAMRGLDEASDYHRRLIDGDGNPVVFGKWPAPARPVVSPKDFAPFWIVMALDKTGPVERHERGYVRHKVKDAAVSEARRLSRELGGRFAILATVHLTGWIDTDLTDDGIPF